MKITYLGRRIDGQYERRSWLKRTWRLFIYKLQRTLRVAGILTLVAWFGFGCLKFGINYAHGTVISYVAPVAFAEAVPTTPDFPILDKIAKAESYDSQFCTKAISKIGGCHSYEVGAVLIHQNSNGTYDIGKFAINSSHLADAIALGDDVYTEEGNTAYAIHLFETQGSVPWTSSQGVWDR